MVISSMGMTMSVAAQDRFIADPAITTHNWSDPYSGSDFRKPTTYTIPNYEEYSNKVIGNGHREFPLHQRYSYSSIYNNRLIGPIKLRNIVTPALMSQDKTPEFDMAQETGGLYFLHGYDRYKKDDVVTPPQFQNVDLDKIAAEMISNKNKVLKMTGHADTSGNDDLNQKLSENRIETAKHLFIDALRRQGLEKKEAQELYDSRVAPHTTIVALGETCGPVATSDNKQEQGNRVVTFTLMTQAKPPYTFASKMMKTMTDFDNHEHTVVLRLGAETAQKDISFYPHYHDQILINQVAIADENTNFIVKIDPARQKPFTIKHYAPNASIADNTNFLIESDIPGAVTSAYNFDTGAIDISVNKKVMISINTMNNNIDPALLRIGQVDSQGNAVISPLENLEAVTPISEIRTVDTERNVLTHAADRIVHLSIDAKHLYLDNQKNPTAYLQALKDYRFEEKLCNALQVLERCGIETKTYETFLINSYCNPSASYYAPGQIVFPFQTYEGLVQSQPNQSNRNSNIANYAYKELLKTIQKNQESGKVPSVSKTVSPASLSRK